MTTEEQTREMLAEKSLEDKQRAESMLKRAREEDSHSEDSHTEGKARELAAQEREKEKQRSDSMVERAAEESHI